ncbi:LysM peptidoglycan-binding domain-containing protein [Streptomyces tsukubensis]|uniref:LysM peptidoglycan-binding domain-containing protein n=1 Tax=Streptomyces tsukubensis TaxID=83656 RepID=UPI00277B4D7A|nr:transglycosylase family protein [Streptomyces tsukubensis]
MGPHFAPTGTDWQRVAACESSGRWHTNTGNGYHGGLQFDNRTWRAYGGQSYAPRADLASQSQQIAVAERVVQDRGLSAWPVCGRLGATNHSSRDTASGSGARQAPSVNAPARQHEQSYGPTAGGSSSESARRTSGTSAHHGPSPTARTYVVRSGDCLSAIAHSAHVHGGTQGLYELNKQQLDEGPDHIYPGQRLTLRT